MLGDQLGDRVLDLDARVDLEEVPAAVGGEQELGRAGADVADGLGQAQRGARPARARSSAPTAGEGASSTTFWCRRCTEQSRSPRCRPRAVRVAQDLHLDVARAST